MHTKNGNNDGMTLKHLTLVSSRVESSSDLQQDTAPRALSLRQQVISSGSTSLRDLANETRHELDNQSKRGAAVDSAIHALTQLSNAGISCSSELKDALEKVNGAVHHLKENEPETAVGQLQAAILFLQQVPTKSHPLKGASRLLRETLDELLKAANGQLTGEHDQALVAITAAEDFQIEACRRVVDCYIDTSTSR